MAQLDPMHRHGDNPRNTTTPTEQFLGVGDAQTWSPRSYSSSSARNQVVHDPEDVQYHSKKSNVLVKVKEKARRWRHGFVKKNSEGDNTTPSWGVGLEDDEDNEDEDPEYLGAPMYESELAPEGYKENARQNPRAVPVISEKHVLASCVKPDAISPRRTPGDVGVMEKVKGAVNSLLWREEPAQYTINQSDTNSSPQIPISTKAEPGMTEDSKGRILQTN